MSMTGHVVAEESQGVILSAPENPSVTVMFEFVDASRAAAILDHWNHHNRSMRARHVATLAAAMERGEFVFNGDTLRFAADGGLLDGQHRLAAIVASGKGQWMVFVRGLPAEATATLDIGARRTAGDILGLAGHADTNFLAAVARGVWLYERYGQVTSVGGSYPDATPAALIDLLARRPDLPDDLPPRQSAVTKRGWMAAIAYLCALGDREAATDFFTRLEWGTSVTADELVYQLRERLLRVTARGSSIKMPVPRQAALVVRAWNATVAGERLRRLIVPDRVPRIAGCPIVPMVDREDAEGDRGGCDAGERR